MTPAQATIEAERAGAGLVTTPQAEQQMRRGQADVIAQLQSTQAAYEEWLGTEAGIAAKEHAEVFALHLAFDGGWTARAKVVPFSDLESEAEYAAMLDWLSVRGPIE